MKKIVKEKWKQLVYNKIIFENYEVSNLGKIRSIGRWVWRTNNSNTTYKQWYPSRVLKQRTNNIHPHLFCDCWNDGKRTTIYVHKAVYDNFGGPQKDYVSHKDGNTWNNFIGNLYPVTHSELQVRNMHTHPKARWRLSKHNYKSGYYQNGGNGRKKLEKILIEEIKLQFKEGSKPLTIAEDLEISLSSVYKYKD